ncbi:SH3 domain-containing protein [Neobacillus sp. D3-1R]|uniref:SH3 domain-containing protein n=1 Tax=Neobacillus sp. D3-1R TaxID=3445778 RepID=UPI003F9FBB86
MEFIKEILATIWVVFVGWPLFARVTLFLLIIGYFALRLVNRFFPSLILFLLKVLTKVLDIVFSILLYHEFLLTRFLRKKNENPIGFAYSVGEGFHKILVIFTDLKMFPIKWLENRKLIFSRSRNTFIAITLLLAVLLWINPNGNNGIVKKWSDFEGWFMSYHDGNYKVNAAGIWKETTYYRLIEKYNEVPLRDTPSIKGKTVIIVKQGEKLEYMNEDTFDNGKVWYKVRNPQGKIGWIGDHAIQKY